MLRTNLRPINIFYCYAEKDIELRDQLDRHLGNLKTSGMINILDERQIAAGLNKEREVEDYIHKADIVLMLISPDFFQSKYDIMKKCIDMHNSKRQLCIVPVLLRSYDWQESLIGTLQALPRDGKPVTGYLSQDHDQVFLRIAEEIKIITKSLLKGIFVYFASEDADFTRPLVNGLEAHGYQIWGMSSRFSESSIDQVNELRSLIRGAQYILYIASPNSRQRHPLQDILTIASSYNQRITPIWIAGAEWRDVAPLEWKDGGCLDPYIDAREIGYEMVLADVLKLLSGTKEDRSFFPLSRSTAIVSAIASSFQTRNPYKGLYSFKNNKEDIQDFFGREALIDDLVKSLEGGFVSNTSSQKAFSNFMAVVGPSGSGKSSVVNAGLLPRLKNVADSANKQWKCLTITPGLDPIEELVNNLFIHIHRSHEELRVALMDEKAKGLYSLTASLALQEKTKIVLFIDQFEELFAQSISEEQRKHFITLLIEAVTDPKSSIIVIITMRADFLDRPMKYPELYDLIYKHQRPVRPMNAQELRSVIEGPAALEDVQITFENDLVGDLAFEMGRAGSPLPILQLMLDLLFKRRNGRQLTQQAYKELGELAGVLKNYVEDIYINLPSEEHQKMARELFIRLIDSSSTIQNILPRRAAMSELEFDANNSKIMDEVVKRFVDSGVLTTGIQGSTIEVVHTIVLQEWEKTQEWLRDEQTDMPIRQRLAYATSQWIAGGNNPDSLYRGKNLKEALGLEKRRILNQNEKLFIQVSRKRSRRNKIGIGAVATVAASGPIAVIAFLWQQQIERLQFAKEKAELELEKRRLQAEKEEETRKWKKEKKKRKKFEENQNTGWS